MDLRCLAVCSAAVTFFSIVIPVYNTSDSLSEIAKRIDAVFETRPDDRYELILVDDASPNAETWTTIDRLATQYPTVRGVQLMRNFGQQCATICGFREAAGDFVITMDDDLQHVPEELPAFLDHTQHDVVIGQFERKRHGPLKRLASRIKGYFDHILIGKPRHIQMSAYRMLSRNVIDGILAIRTPNPFIPALIFNVSNDIVGVPVRHEKRSDGRTGYTLRKQIRLFSNLLINNSSLLLRLVGQFGIVIALLSLGLAAYTVYRYLAHGVSVQGWTSLFVAILFFGGLLLFSIGVVGEYLIRIIESAELRPTYLIRRRAGSGEVE